MIIVADTSPLNYLIQLDLAEALHDAYEKVVVPEAVLAELNDPGAPAIVKAWVKDAPVWFSSVSVQQVDPELSRVLDRGEAEAITLATVLHPHLLLIDERFGRQIAEARNVPVLGTLGVLFEICLKGRLDFELQLDGLRSLKFYASRDLYDQMRAKWRNLKTHAQ